AGKDWVEEKTGNFVPLDARFTDETGAEVALRDIIDRPTLLLPIYFYCPSACSQTLANLATSLKQLKSVAGKDFRVIAYSFNEKETAEDAGRAKKNYLKLLDPSFPASEWRYLTGSRETILAVTTAIGYRFQRMADETYIHPSALVAVAGDGKIIRYVYGSFIPGDIDMAIADAAKGTPSLSVKRLLGMCFGSDPNANKSVFNTVKVVVSAAFLGGIAAFVFFFRKRNRRSGEGRGHNE
ncbi:MAG: SCO family protein, partial [Desulfoprunum sp.]|nr:SCO family protein [Desulfoprunum sp.]